MTGAPQSIGKSPPLAVVIGPNLPNKNEDQDFCMAIGGKKPSFLLLQKSGRSGLGVAGRGWRREPGSPPPPGGACERCRDSILCIIASCAGKFISLDFSVMRPMLTIPSHFLCSLISGISGFDPGETAPHRAS